MTPNFSAIDPQWAWSSYEPDDTMPWDITRAAHLMRRAGFCATRGELDEALRTEPRDVVARLFEPPSDAAGFEQGSADLAAAMLATGNPQNLAPWWLHRMLNTPQPLVEKMTLFWHGHFATGAEKVQDAQAMYQQNQLLRQHALGDFRELAQGISRDPAMLIYLDSATNRKAHPNENYARELMELFCLGEGNYSEEDVQQLARCFTGWEIRRKQFRFNRYQHDDGEKTLLGHRGVFGGEEAVDIVLQQPVAPRFIVRKLFRFFVCDEPEAPAELLEPLAQQLRDDGLVIAPTLQRMLGSRLFFSPDVMGRKVRAPVELAIGLLRSLQGTANLQRLAPEVATLGQSLFYPPNVKGWDGGRAWINSSTLIARANLVLGLVHHENTRFAGGKLNQLVAQQGLKSPESLVDYFAQLLLAVPLSESVKQQLCALADNGDRSLSCDQTLCALGALPEFQLA